MNSKQFRVYIYGKKFVFFSFLISLKTPTVRPPAPITKLFKLGEPDMQDIAGEAEMNS